MENRSYKELSKQEHNSPTLFPDATQPSDSPDLQFPITFGVVMSCRLGDVQKIRSQIQEAGGRIVFQTVSNNSLFLLRAAQVEKALQGDLSVLTEIHNRKTRRSEKT
ncbi:MAG: hypothetical protein ABSF00_03490 [Candidatus Bathyarchaeia archaeon]